MDRIPSSGEQFDAVCHVWHEQLAARKTQHIQVGQAGQHVIEMLCMYYVAHVNQSHYTEVSKSSFTVVNHAVYAMYHL